MRAAVGMLFAREFTREALAANSEAGAEVPADEGPGELATSPTTTAEVRD